ncbi:MAG: hypothetical protein LBQ60_09310 [Bacteroidales bacterium]|nr:hypothetical protein [Bacteroidales bacterium]
MFRMISVLFCFCVYAQVYAQGPDPSRRGPKNDDRGEQFKVERIAYFTEKMGLTTEEAQSFWPIYNEMDEKKSKLFEERASIMRKFMHEQDQLPEKEVKKLLDRLVVIQEQESKIPVEYDAKFRKILSEQKVMKLYVAEMQFRNYLLQKMRNNRKAEEKHE